MTGATAEPASAPVAAQEPVHGRRAALALLVLLALVWGTHWAIVKIGLQWMPPLTYATLRIGGGLLASVLLLAALGRLRTPPPPDRSIVVTVGLGQIVAGFVLMNLALQFTEAGRSSVLVYSMPLWVAAILLARYGRTPTRPELAGLVAGMAGIALLLNPASIDWGDAGQLLGSGALVVNAISWGWVTIRIRRHRWSASPFELGPWQLVVALVPVALLALAVEGWAGVEWRLETVLVLLYSGPLATTFATWASQAITRSLGAQASATAFLAVPVVGLAGGALILGERLGPVDLAGFVLVLAGVAATSVLPARGRGHTGPDGGPPDAPARTGAAHPLGRRRRDG